MGSSHQMSNGPISFKWSSKLDCNDAHEDSETCLKTKMVILPFKSPLTSVPKRVNGMCVDEVVLEVALAVIDDVVIEEGAVIDEDVASGDVVGGVVMVGGVIVALSSLGIRPSVEVGSLSRSMEMDMEEEEGDFKSALLKAE